MQAHGYGLKNVRRCIDKYNGTMNITPAAHISRFQYISTYRLKTEALRLFIFPKSFSSDMRLRRQLGAGMAGGFVGDLRGFDSEGFDGLPQMRRLGG